MDTSIPTMDLRDYFAATALRRLIKKDEYGVYYYASIANQSYHMADAMLAARTKTKKEETK